MDYASNSGSHPPICTLFSMQDRLRASYKLFADTNKISHGLAGEALEKIDCF